MIIRVEVAVLVVVCLLRHSTDAFHLNRAVTTTTKMPIWRRSSFLSESNKNHDTEIPSAPSAMHSTVPTAMEDGPLSLEDLIRTLPLGDKTMDLWNMYGKLFFTIWATVYFSSFILILLSIDTALLNAHNYDIYPEKVIAEYFQWLGTTFGLHIEPNKELVTFTSASLLTDIVPVEAIALALCPIISGIIKKNDRNAVVEEEDVVEDGSIVPPL